MARSDVTVSPDEVVITTLICSQQKCFQPYVVLQIVMGRLDPFGNKSCEEKSTVDNDSIFSRYNASYSEMVRQSVLHQ